MDDDVFADIQAQRLRSPHSRTWRQHTVDKLAYAAHANPKGYGDLAALLGLPSVNTVRRRSIVADSPDVDAANKFLSGTLILRPALVRLEREVRLHRGAYPHFKDLAQLFHVAMDEVEVTKRRLLLKNGRVETIVVRPEDVQVLRIDCVFHISSQ